MNKIVVICGPTATGKTNLGIRLAQKFDGEIISADSRQIYRGMDIGTGKDLPQNAKLNPSTLLRARIQNSKLQVESQDYQVGYYLFDGIPVWLLDVVGQDQLFSVADYYQLAWMVMEDIWRRGKLPFLVGGTGFYIKAVIEGIESLGIPPDWELRKILGDEDTKILGEELKKLDPKRWEGMNKSDRKNPRRLVRAIEIAEKSQKSKVKSQNYNAKLKIDKLLMIGLTAPYKILYQRIDKRVDERVKMGAEKEVRDLLAKGYLWNLPSMSGHGYFEWRPYLEGKQSLDEMIKRWKYDEHGYARRQMTWFRKNKRIKWFNIEKQGFDKEIEMMVKSFYAA